jgi:hypothetical protein
MDSATVITVVVLVGVAGLALWPTRHERSSKARRTSAADTIPISGLAVAPFHDSSPTPEDPGPDGGGSDWGGSDGGGDGGGGGGD